MHDDHKRTFVFAIASGIVGTIFMASAGVAQSYPTKPVRIIAGSPGTASDILSRYLGQQLSERWRQGVVVENRGAQTR
jgi:tripartite-type tricarboxylate transporter receptor subunit TctC